VTALTSQQSKLLQFIAEFSTKQGFCPSYRQMMTAIGLHSTSNVSRIVKGLEERGFIRRMPNRERAIEVLERVTVKHELTPDEVKEKLADFSTIELRRELVRRQEGVAAC